MSQFVVSARKFRPVRFDEVVGQTHVTSTLKNALQSGQIAHAFLFCGPRGIGKTSCARILAKALNCENPADDKEPCNECTSCKTFNENASFNILELDAASNNSVEHMRSLVEQVAISPPSGGYKIFIIDEVHMLSASAFNAFLKTLEEPPPYAIFILATTEKHKILPTILSRCQVYDFRRIEIEDIVEHLKQICKHEKVEADVEALYVIAEKADGALRDALSIFDRVNNLSDHNITYDEVIKNMGILDYQIYFDTVDHMLSENIPALMLLLDKILLEGYSGGHYFEGLSKHLRDLMFYRFPHLKPLVKLPDHILNRYESQSKLCGETLLVNSIDMINESLMKADQSANKKIHFQITLTKLAYIHRLQINDFGLKKKESPDKSVKNTQTTSKTPTIRAKSLHPTTKTTEKLISNTGITADLQSLKKQVIEKDKSRNGIKCDDEIIKQYWKEFYASRESAYIQTSLKHVEVGYENDTVHIYVGHQAAHDLVNKTVNFPLYLRQELKMPNLRIETHIDTSMVEQKKEAPRRFHTNKERYDFLVEKNPLLKELTKRLDLKIDN